jgi:hypothetical protein
VRSINQFTKIIHQLNFKTMKMKNLMKLRTLLLMLIVSSAMILSSCSKDDEIVEGDKTALDALITDADALAAAATTANYPQAAITDFEDVLQTVKTAAAKKLTQAQIDNLNTQLTQAMTTFNSLAYGFIDEALYLTAGWHFDEGTGTTATAYSTVQHVATFKAGNAGVFAADALSPTWVAGVKGGNAVFLNKGAHLEVPYTTAFLPANISISAWVKPLELYENNYIVSQNFWNGYKFQIQDLGKPFFTYKKATGEVIDADNELVPSVIAGEWNHVVVTLDGTTKLLKFYVNGTLTKTWTETDKVAQNGIGAITQTLDPAPQPFIIGCIATDTEIASWAWTETPTSLGYFKGAIDELKIYNIALTNGQVAKLYNDEKP